MNRCVVLVQNNRYHLFAVKRCPCQLTCANPYKPMVPMRWLHSGPLSVHLPLEKTFLVSWFGEKTFSRPKKVWTELHPQCPQTNTEEFNVCSVEERFPRFQNTLRDTGCNYAGKRTAGLNSICIKEKHARRGPFQCKTTHARRRKGCRQGGEIHNGQYNERWRCDGFTS